MGLSGGSFLKIRKHLLVREKGKMGRGEGRKNRLPGEDEDKAGLEKKRGTGGVQR